MLMVLGTQSVLKRPIWMPKDPKCAQDAHLDAEGCHFEGIGLPTCPPELYLVVAAYFLSDFSVLLFHSLVTVVCFCFLLSAATRFM